MNTWHVERVANMFGLKSHFSAKKEKLFDELKIIEARIAAGEGNEKGKAIHPLIETLFSKGFNAQGVFRCEFRQGWNPE